MKFVELVTIVTMVERMEELMIVMSVQYNLVKKALVKVELVISIEKFVKKEFAT